LYEVYVNGVPQQAGKDYDRLGNSLFFTRELKQEGSLGFWRWTSIFLGIAGTYRQDDWSTSSTRRTVSARSVRGCRSLR
jgi:hypothetical protein